LLGQKLGSVGFMHYAIARAYHGVGRYWAPSPGVVGFVWEETAVEGGVKSEKESGVKVEVKQKVGGEERDVHVIKVELDMDVEMDKKTLPPAPTKPFIDIDTDIDMPDPKLSPILSPSPLRALVLSVLTTYWSRFEAPHIVRHKRTFWEAVFDAYPDLRRDFIFELQGNRKILAVQGYFAQQIVKGERN
jgi:hypothetical protein